MALDDLECDIVRNIMRKRRPLVNVRIVSSEVSAAEGLGQATGKTNRVGKSSTNTGGRGRGQGA